MEWTFADELHAPEIDWKFARRIHGVRRWKVMTQNKANSAYERLVEHYTTVFLGDIKEAYRVATNDMRNLYGLEKDQQTRIWHEVPVAWRIQNDNFNN